MKIVWRARARADMFSLLTYIARDSPSAAYRVHDDILRMVSLLVDWPDLGRSGRKPRLRELVVPRTPYLALYRRERSAVVILRVLHGARNR